MCAIFFFANSNTNIIIIHAHKTADYCREVNEAIDRAIEDEAITPNEVKSLKLNLNRVEGSYNNHESPPNDNTGNSPEAVRKQSFDCFCMYALTGEKNELPIYEYPIHITNHTIHIITHYISLHQCIYTYHNTSLSSICC